MREEEFGFNTRHSTTLQLARLVKRINRNIGEGVNRRSFYRHGQSHRYRLDQWPPVQVNAPKLPVLHSPYNIIEPPGSDVRSVRPDGNIISSWHAGWGG